MERHVELSPRAEQDLRRIGPGPQQRIIARAIDGLAVGRPGLDIKAVEGRSGWLRLRAGAFRVLFRNLGHDEAPEGPGFLVARIVHCRDLDRAVHRLT